MIIRKKKNTNIENINKNQSELQITPQEQVQNQEVSEGHVVSVFDVDNFDFLQRDERRRGDRRRGYRRIDDRNLVSRAQVEAVSIKEEAVKDGYNKGLEQAQEEIAQVRSALEEFFSYKEKVAEELAKNILDISVDIAQTIIKTEVSQDKEILLLTIIDILKTTGKSEDRVTLKVSNDDVEYVKLSVPQVLSLAQSEARISVVGMDGIDQGSVIVETSNGVVDASFKTQLGVIKEAFKGI